jgi:hypothetical protein
MKLTRLFATAALATSLCSLPLLAQDVKTDYDHKADFTKYHTFSFHKVQASDPLYEGRIKDGITRYLTAKGLQLVPTGGDLAVAAVGAMQTKQEYNTFYDNLGGGFGRRGWGGWGGGWGGDATTTETDIPVGTLVVNLFDTQTHQLVWRGTSTDELSNKPDKDTKKLDKAIDKMFQKFPPKTT